MKCEIRKAGSFKVVYTFQSVADAVQAYSAELAEHGYSLDHDGLVAYLRQDQKVLYTD